MFLLIFIVVATLIGLWLTNDNLAMNYYKEGLLKFKYKKFKEADSLFTLSISKVKKPHTYYMLGLSKFYLNDKRGYFDNILIATNLGDSDAKRVFNLCCRKRDSLNYDNPYNKDSIFYSIITTYKQINKSQQIFYIKNLINGNITAFTVAKDNSINFKIEDFNIYFPDLNIISPERITYLIKEDSQDFLQVKNIFAQGKHL